MLEFFRKLFATDFTPHIYCIRIPEVIWLHEWSDLTIALSYFLIPIALIYLLRVRRDLAYPWMFLLFSIFILSCGSTHVMAFYVLRHPAYRLDGLIKAVTAVSSFPTALLLFRLVPQVRLLASPEQLRQQNAALEAQMAERQVAEAEVRRLNQELEHRVAERTEALHQTNIELRRANEDLRQFAWAASHDLQEPLRMVQLYTQMAERSEADRLSDSGKHNLRVAREAANRMFALITDILAYTDLAREHSDEQGRVSDGEAALAQAMDNLALAINETGARISHAPIPDLPIRHALLVQLFQNLLSNAIKYARPSVPPEIEITCGRQGNEWVISVRDNGIGIEPQFHQQVFGMFKRLHGNSIPGTGIGLALCQRIVEGMSGRIWLESAGEGTGTSFHFILPAADLAKLN